MSDDDFEIEEEGSDNVCAEEDDRDHEGVKPPGPGRGRAKKPNRKKAQKINYTKHGVFENETEAMLELDRLAKDTYGVSSKGSGIKYKMQVWGNLVRAQEQYRIGFCHFHKESDCRNRIKLTRPFNSNEVTIWCSDVVHSDHSKSNRIRGLSSFARTKESPSKLTREKPVRYVNNLCDAGITVSPHTRKQAEQYLFRVKKAIMLEGIERGTEHTFGAISTVLDRCKIRIPSLPSLFAFFFIHSNDRASNLTLSDKPENMNLSDFNDDTPFLVGDYICDSLDNGLDGLGRIAALISTENLLLNGYRARVVGDMPLQIQIDTTYRLVVEGYGTMILGVTSLDQTFHLLGYAIVNKEDTTGHKFVLRQLKDGIEAVVTKYAREGRDI